MLNEIGLGDNAVELIRYVDRFQEVRILVIGDVILDEYVWGKVSRISPEAPVPVVEVGQETKMLGGAANVLNNIVALGGKSLLCGVIGDDQTGGEIIDRVKDAYDKKEQDVTPEIMRELEKFVLLQGVDNQWKDHLLSMDHLKEGIGLRGYGQRDPLKEYQKEGYDLFLDMSQRIKEESVRTLLLVKLAAEEDLEELAPQREQEKVMSRGDGGGDGSRSKTVRRSTEKIGRNSPCPCGSGKKYKKCCGKAA